MKLKMITTVSSGINFKHILGFVLLLTFFMTTLLTRNQFQSFQVIQISDSTNKSQLVNIVRPLVTNQTSIRYPSLKYVRVGPAINCLQRPLSHPGMFDTNEMNNSSKRYAYAWYVSRTAYLCSALAALKKLKKIRSVATGKSAELKVDYVLIFSGENFQYNPKSPNSQHVKDMFSLWEKEGGILRNFKSLSDHVKDGYYKGCYEKFYVFMLTEYSRVILMDADGIVVNNIDHLFWLGMPPGIQLAAPQGYWFNNEGLFETKSSCFVHHSAGKQAAITSVLLLVKPGQNLFDRVKPYFGQYMSWTSHEYFDMDIINQEFSCKHESLVLPKMYGTLDSEYTKETKLSQRMMMCKNFTNVQYLHFSGMGKPWSWGRGAESNVNAYTDDAAVVVREWLQYAHESCPWMVSAPKGSEDESSFESNST